jgi:hypothetical protein
MKTVLVLAILVGLVCAEPLITLSSQIAGYQQLVATASDQGTALVINVNSGMSRCWYAVDMSTGLANNLHNCGGPGSPAVTVGTPWYQSTTSCSAPTDCLAKQAAMTVELDLDNMEKLMTSQMFGGGISYQSEALQISITPQTLKSCWAGLGSYACQTAPSPNPDSAGVHWTATGWSCSTATDCFVHSAAAAVIENIKSTTSELSEIEKGCQALENFANNQDTQIQPAAADGPANL